MTDTSTPRPAFETFDPAVAELMTTAAGEMGGIPDYLAIRTVEVGPGTMTAELDVRPELLNPFGSAHGGTLAALADHVLGAVRSEEHTSELQSLMRISYAVFCLKKKTTRTTKN